MARPLRVLIIEDSPDDAELMLLELRRGGFAPSWQRVETAEALRAALAQGGWEIVLWDYTLPGLDAATALALLKQTSENLPFIVVSGTIGEEQAVRLMKGGADDYLLKGNIARLAPAVERTLREAADRRARKQAEIERDRLLERLRLQIERLPLAYMLFDADNRVLDWNPAAEKVFGYTKEEMVGRAVLDVLVPLPIGDQMRDVLHRVRAGDMDAHSVNENRTKDGRIITCQWFNTPLMDPGGRFASVISLAQDITEHKRAEAALRESEERFRRYFELGLIGMAITSPTKGCLEVNDEICRILGYEHDELLKKTWEEMTYPDDLAADATNFDRVKAGEIDAYTIDKRWVRKDGRVIDSTISVKCLRREDGSVDYFVALLQDITERKRAEEELRQVHEELEARVRERTGELAQTNEALQSEIRERRRAEVARTELLRRLATAEEDERRRLSLELHDQVGQHVLSLSLGLKALRDGGQHPAPEQGLLERLQKIAEEIGREVHDLALRLRPSALDDLGLLAALQSAVEEWSRRSGVEVDFHSAGLEGRRLPGEVETALYRVVLEALHNTLKHAQARHVSVILERRDHHAVAIVEDDGMGFDAEAAMMGKAPERLGLLSMRERVALVGGTLEVESTPGIGTTVFARIQLPSPEERGQT